MSETFQVTARKWRPMRFDSVIGQDHVTRTLKNAIRENRLAHAYLFTGQRGCGKTTVARLLAKAINCPNAAKNDYEPCNNCDVCLSITEGRSMDVAEIDGASNNGVEDVRGLRENVKYPPLQGQYKVIIIDEVHMLSNSAFNALLKTLEEPPKYLVFIFATTEVQKVLPTILSRTQRYDFRRIQIEEITSLLRKIADADGITIDDDALLMIAKKADGSARDAESIFDQTIAYCGMTVETARLREALNLIDLDFYFEVTSAITAREPKRAFELSGEVVARGYDVEEFFAGLLEHFRNILTVAITGETKLIEVSRSHAERYSQITKDFPESDLIRLVRLGQQALEKLHSSQQPRIVLEITLVEMMLLERALEISQLIAEVRALRGAAVPSGYAPPPPAPAPRPTAEARPASPPTPSSTVSRASSSPRVQPPHEVTPTVRQPVAPQASEAVAVENDTISQRWLAFGDFVRTKSRGLFTIFPELEFCGVRKSMVYLAVPGKIERDLLQSLKDEMTQALSEFFGTRLAFEAGTRADMHAKAGSPVVNNPEIVAQVIKQAKPTQEKSALEVAIIEQLDAREV